MGSDRLINLPKSWEKKSRNKMKHLPHESGHFNLSSIQNLTLSLTAYRIRKLEVILFLSIDREVEFIPNPAS
jgi:hypothetical protein